MSNKGALLSSNIYRSKKDIEYIYPNAKIRIKQLDEYEIEVSTDKFARAVYLNPHNNNIVLSDNYFDLLPGFPTRIVSSKPIKAKDIEIMCVNNK